MIIQHNIMALNAHRQLGGNNNTVQKNLEKLSSGYKINRAGDDAAGLAISEKMRAQITGLTRAQSNAQDGISLVQTAEGALTEVHSMLNRMVDLSTQSSNGTLKDDDRQKIQDEMNSLTEEIDRISKSTNFNGINLLDGSLGNKTSGTAGSGYAEFKMSDAAKAAGAYKFTDAIAGVTKSGNFDAAAGATVAGGKVDMTVVYKDGSGNDKTLKITLTAKDGTTLVAADGTTYKATATATKGELNAAFLAELKKTDMAKDFDMATATDAITFTSKEKGTAAASITTTFVREDLENDGTANAMFDASAVVTVAADKFDSLDLSKFAAWDGSTDMAKADVFEVNGSKFLFVQTGVTDAQLAKLAPGVTAIKMAAGGTNPVTGDRAEATKIISNKTGLTATNNGGNATTIDFKPAPGTITTEKGNGLSLQVGDTADEFNKVVVSVDDMGAKGLGVEGIKVDEQGVSDAAIANIKSAIQKVSTNRSAMGALQNRLEHTINNLGVATENMTAAESRIRDVDMAKEMMMFTKNNVLSQAAQAMLAQANQQPQQVLQLLR